MHHDKDSKRCGENTAYVGFSVWGKNTSDILATFEIAGWWWITQKFQKHVNIFVLQKLPCTIRESSASLHGQFSQSSFSPHFKTLRMITYA